MKKLTFIIITLIFASNIYSQSYSGYSRLINFESGYKFLSNNLGTFHVASMELNYHAPKLCTTYSIRADVGKNYWSIEPCSALGFLWLTTSQATGSYYNYAPITKLLIVCLAGSSMKFPINIYYGMFEICPSYSLLRLTYINNQGYLTGSVGLSFNYYINKYVYLNSQGYFDWGYKNEFGLGYSVQVGLGIQIPLDK